MSQSFDQECESEPAAQNESKPILASRILGFLPSVLVISTLIGLAWFGHQKDWKFSGSTAPQLSAESSDVEWCDAHGVPEEQCINCTSGLVEEPPKLSFCQLHGVHGCLFENPGLAEAKKQADSLTSDLERAERALSIRPRRENLALSRLPGSRIQFANIKAMKRAGVDVEPVERRDLVESISTAGEVLYDANLTAQVSSSVDGIVRHVSVKSGDWVSEGEVLAIIDSEKVGRLKSELLASLSKERLHRQTVERLIPLADSQAIAGKRLIEAKVDWQQATVSADQAARALRNLGLQIDVESICELDPVEATKIVRNLGLDKIESSTENLNLFPNENWIAVIAPLEGRVVQRNVVVGEVFDRGRVMFRISDTRKVWLDLRVAAEEAHLTSLGQEVRYHPDGTDKILRGIIVWISSDVDVNTRTVRVRAELANEKGALRNESFGRGSILLREETQAIVVPADAVQWDGENTIVFVRDKRFFEQDRPKFFITRSVRVGVTEGNFTEIIAGVLPGEVVASVGSDVLRAQLLKSNLGAGCTCGH